MSTDRSRRGLTDDDASSPLPLDPRAILGVGPDVTARELRTAYRRALLAAHPDQGGSREELDLVRSAYDGLRGSVRPDGSPAPTSPPSPNDAAPRTSASGRLLPDPSLPEAGPTSAAVPTPSASAGPAAPPSSTPTMTPANARAAAKFVTAQRFATAGEPSPPSRRRRATRRRRNRFEQLLERELVRRSDRRVRLAGATDHAGAGA